MVKIIKMVSLVMIISCLVGCGKGDKTSKNINNAKETPVSITDTISGKFDSKGNTGERYAERYQMVSLSEAGIIYTDYKDGFGTVHLVTIDKGEDIVLCYNTNCTHSDDSCMAALYDDGYCETAYYEGAVYFFVNEGLFKHRVYKMETNGAGRELIAELPFAFNISYAAIFCGDVVYYTAQIPHVDDITNKVSYTYRLVEVALLDGSYRFITEESDDLLSVVNMGGTLMFLRKADTSSGGSLYATTVDINTLEEKIIISQEDWVNGYTYIDVYDGDSFFFYDRNKYEIGIMNVDGTIEKILLMGAEGEYFGWTDPSCDGLYYQRLFDYGDEIAGHYFMDLTTGEVTNITDEQAKYNIVGYDGYYDVFVARDEEFNWSMWSKEKVLGEAKE